MTEINRNQKYVNRRAARSRGKGPEVERKGKRLIGKENIYILKKTTKQERKKKEKERKEGH